jgi:hypothetical protein
MPLSRRSLLVASAAGAAIPGRLRAQTRPVVRIGVINDMSGPYRDVMDPRVWPAPSRRCRNSPPARST